MHKAVLPILVVIMLNVSRGLASENRVDFFEKRIRPVLDQRCYDCHSARSEEVQGGLRLDCREEILRGGDHGPAVVPGNPQASLLVQAIRHLDPDHLAMPPDGLC